MSEENIINQDTGMQEGEKKIYLNDISMRHLVETARWAKIIAIIGFVFIGILVIVGFSMGGIMSLFTKEVMPFPMFIFGFVYLIIGAIYFYPLFALFKFSNYSKTAVAQLDSQQLALSLKNLRGVFTFIGILTLIGAITFVLEIGAILIFMPFIMH